MTWKFDLFLNVVAEIIGVILSIVVVYLIIERYLEKRKNEEREALQITANENVGNKIAEIRSRLAVIINILRNIHKTKAKTKKNKLKKELKISLNLLMDKKKNFQTFLDLYSSNLQKNIDKFMQLEDAINSINRAIMGEEYFPYWGDDPELNLNFDKDTASYYKGMIEVYSALDLINDIFSEINLKDEMKKTGEIIKVLHPIHKEVIELLGWIDDLEESDLK